MKVKIAKLGTIISGILTLIFGLSDIDLKIMIRFASGTSIDLNDPSVIGIIGGADGPTAVFIGSNVFSGFKYILTLLFFIITLLCIIFWRKNDKRTSV